MKKGQILLITLLVLTILSIVTVTLIVLNRRDVKQTVSSEKYEDIYNTSETKLQELIDKYNTKATLNTIATDNGCFLAGSEVDCSFNIDGSILQYVSEVNVSDEKDIINYTISKDRPLELYLERSGAPGYQAMLDISWTKDAALEFTLIYDVDPNLADSVRDLRTIKDVYDGIGLFDSTTRQFTYLTLDPLNTRTSVRLDLNNTNNMLLAITPRTPTGIDSTDITVRPSDSPTYPLQVRKFTSVGYHSADQNSPIVTLITQMPLNPQTQGLFDYAINTPDQIEVR